MKTQNANVTDVVMNPEEIKVWVENAFCRFSCVPKEGVWLSTTNKTKRGLQVLKFENFLEGYVK